MDNPLKYLLIASMFGASAWYITKDDLDDPFNGERRTSIDKVIVYNSPLLVPTPNLFQRKIASPTNTPIPFQHTMIDSTTKSERKTFIPKYIKNPQEWNRLGLGDLYYNTMPNNHVFYVEDSKYGCALKLEDYISLEEVSRAEFISDRFNLPNFYSAVHPPKESGLSPFGLITLYRDGRVIEPPLYPVEGYRYTPLVFHE